MLPTNEEITFFSIVTCIVILAMSVISGVCSIPLLGWYLKGPRKVYSILQQLCITLYLIFLVATQTSINRNNNNPHFKSIPLGTLSSYVEFWVEQFLSLGRWILYCDFYFFSLMQSVDVYVMICHSFEYEGFTKTRNIVKITAIGASLCCLGCVDNLVRTSYEYMFLQDIIDYDYDFLRRMLRGTWYFAIVKLGVIKIAYAVTISKIGYAVKSKLDASTELMRNDERVSLYQSLTKFVYIPLITNFILLGHDIPYLANLYLISYSVCDSNISSNIGFWQNMSAIGFTIASFSHVLGYAFLFPKLANAFACFKACSAKSRDTP